MKYYLICFLSFWMLCHCLLYSQTDTAAVSRLNFFVKHIDAFNHLVPQEKVYLHFDNTNYILGETIWFKAYVVVAAHHKPTDQSGVLYVELLNQKGKVLETKKLKIINGQCHGEFELDIANAQYNPGFYEVRAYTKAMLNFEEEILFSRVFPVFDDFSTDTDYKEKNLKDNIDVSFPNLRKKVSKGKKINLDFYPEGGNLIKGIENMVAFKATDEYGRSIDLTGAVCRQSGDTITTFSTIHSGMGVFYYCPGENADIVKVRFEKKVHTYNLPESLSAGYSLTVNNYNKNTLTLHLKRSEDIPAIPLGLSVLCRGALSYFQIIDFTSTSHTLKIHKELLSSGVNQITLFDSKGEIFAERLVFIQPEEKEIYYHIEPVLNKKIYQPLEKVSVDFNLLTDKPFKTSFSLAIRDAERMTFNSDVGNIATELLLSSDLKGYIEDPAYYFENNDLSRIQALDLLMMVQGWRRYDWQTYAGLKPFVPQYELERGLIIKGMLPFSGGKNAKVNLKLKTATGETMDGVAKTNKDAVFYFTLEDYYGKAYLYLHSRTIKNGSKNIRLDRWFSPAPKFYLPQETAWLNYIDRMKDDEGQMEILKRIRADSTDMSFLIQEVNISTRREKDIVYNIGQDVDRLIDLKKKVPFSLHDFLLSIDDNYLFEAYTLPPSMPITNLPIDEVAIFNDPFAQNAKAMNSRRNKLSGNFYYKQPDRITFFHLYEGEWSDFDYKIFKTGKGLDASKKNFTALRPVLDVEEIRISGIKYRDERGERSIPVYITPYKDYFVRNSQGTRLTAFAGFSKPKDFFKSVKYTEEGLPETIEHRRTLYWNPEVKTDESGKVNISFINNLTCRIPDISLEGLTPDGVPICIAPSQPD